ncbi:hypothetical protein CW667_02880 [Candidatus Bathyarchaeota archaeon]|nr:MAG: hypothetical protein CW667_02880 [Candidatus Bathyarchaeota archaeon]RLI17023.1 MAG: hypothetical protein DRO44_04455 [Candidatus Bathyarchaeota archaeon]
MATVVPIDVVEALMGHKGYLTEVYRRTHAISLHAS